MLDERIPIADYVIKLSGKVVDNTQSIARVCDWIASLVRSGEKVILVHGGGKQIDSLCNALGIAPVYVGGRRITDEPTLDAVKMTLAGTVNLAVVASLSRLGIRALGISGASAHLVLARRRPPTLVWDSAASHGSPGRVDYGLVGDVIQVNAHALRDLIACGMIPVIASLAIDSGGQVLNVNADTVAEVIAIATGARRVVLFSDTKGVYLDRKDASTLIRQLSIADLDDLTARGIVSDGMLPKFAACKRMCQGGVAEVRLCSADIELLKIGDFAAADLGGTVISAETHTI